MLFGAMAAASLLTGAAFLLTSRGPAQPPNRLPALGTWIAQHPGDWMAASLIAERSLDLEVPDERRFALWRAAHELAMHLAPNRADPRAGFVRAGLTHWTELSDADRAAVERELEPLLRDETFFGKSYLPIFELNGDLALLRRANPGTPYALETLANLAVMHGRFDDYRALRSEVQRKRLADFEQKRAEATPEELVRAIPGGLDRSDEPLVSHVLELLERNPLEIDPHLSDRMDELVDYALRHGLRPLDGLTIISRTPGAASEPTRARLALAIGAADLAAQIEAANDPQTRGEAWSAYHRERAAWERRQGNVGLAASEEAKAFAAAQEGGWRGLCGTDLCDRAWQAIDGGRPLALRLTTVQTDETPPYVEVYLDDLRVAEGPVEGQRVFQLAPGGGLHRLELRLVNPVTRNRMRRLARAELL